MDKILIIRGNDTNFDDDQLVKIVINSDESLEGYTASFELSTIIIPFSTEVVSTGEIDLVLTASQTHQLQLGAQYGSFTLIDNKGRVKTIVTDIPFEVSDMISPRRLVSQEVSINMLNIKLMHNSREYDDLKGLPTINGVELKGNLTSEDLGLESQPEPDRGPSIESTPTVTVDIRGGKYIDIHHPYESTMYEYASAFTRELAGMTTTNNATSLVNEFPEVIPGVMEFDNDQSSNMSPIHTLKLKEDHLRLLVELSKEDGTPYTFLECINDEFFTFQGVTDLTDENKIAVITALSDKVDPYTKVYAIPVYQALGDPSTTPESLVLFMVYQDINGEYYNSTVFGWLATPVNSTPVGDPLPYQVVDLNKDTADLINQINAKLGNIDSLLDTINGEVI